MSEEVKASSPKQPLLDQYVKIIKEQVGEEAIKDAFINEPNDHMPVLVINKDKWYDVAKLLKDHPEMRFDYLMNLAGVDYEKYMEVAYHFYSYSRNEFLGVKVQTERDGGTVPTVMDIWATADWHEREAYDLLGIGFTGRQISRILLPDDWVGHPLRKDYKPFDEEV
ncbi:NADH-quinone oxidoreductase subunit C [Tepidibacillus fermentans]|uniref:NADH/F420H2 dehydrogenase subunit C n=1 Tax=Tepidibacillus fermentans TaxID=1281767 RepID=A0A4R3KIS8_9BACI|nr:NADH-quinone oxidoreductase subunit C [Tepidibacillus fermentans]TCS83399.1 NADH/F420H2 dehydrogenase subunit C [Tepidibacillus fermentans]